ncbi:hypothetical protein HNR34_003614, partial [Geobacillus subterraneus]
MQMKSAIQNGGAFRRLLKNDFVKGQNRFFMIYVEKTTDEEKPLMY